MDKINYEDIKRVSDMFNEIDDYVGRIRADTMESLLRQVTKKVLGRECTAEDAKDFTFVQTLNNPDNLILFKGKLIGVVKQRMNMGIEGASFTLTFEPT